MQTNYVYELINELGTVEYVGHTANPKKRFYQHVKVKPSARAGFGKFYGRQDITMVIVSSHNTKKEAIKAEFDLQAYWGFETEGQKIGRLRKGQLNPGAKLTSDDVKAIKNDLSKSKTLIEIAAAYGVHPQSISNIKKGRSWSQIIP